MEHVVGNAFQDRMSVHYKEVGGNQRTESKPIQSLEETMNLHADSITQAQNESRDPGPVRWQCSHLHHCLSCKKKQKTVVIQSESGNTVFGCRTVWQIACSFHSIIYTSTSSPLKLYLSERKAQWQSCQTEMLFQTFHILVLYLVIFNVYTWFTQYMQLKLHRCITATGKRWMFVSQHFPALFFCFIF